MGEQNIHVFYLMNGQILFADYLGIDDDTEDYLVKRPVMVMIGQNKQIGMSTAYPFTNIEDDVIISWRQVTVMSDLSWNSQLVAEYNNFWTQLTAQAAGIVLPGQQGTGMKPGPSGRTIHRNMRPTVIK